MGWKSTINISRQDAINTILEVLDRKPLEQMSNLELEEMMNDLGIGDDTDKPYFGHNFIIE